MNTREAAYNRTVDQSLAPGPILDAKIKEFEAGAWLDCGSNMEEARAAVHSAMDAKLDATLKQINAAKAQYRGAA